MHTSADATRISDADTGVSNTRALHSTGGSIHGCESNAQQVGKGSNLNGWTLYDLAFPQLGTFSFRKAAKIKCRRFRGHGKHCFLDLQGRLLEPNVPKSETVVG